jgi:hypothetical protein
MEMLDSLAAGVGTLEQLGANPSAITDEQMFLSVSLLVHGIFLLLFSSSPHAVNGHGL